MLFLFDVEHEVSMISPVMFWHHQVCGGWLFLFVVEHESRMISPVMFSHHQVEASSCLICC